MITIYHNPRCSKSRDSCERAGALNTHGEPVEIIEYLKHPPTVQQLKKLNAMLKCPVRDMIRNSEKEFDELRLADPALTDSQLYEAIAQHPVLLQRPIVVRDGRAVIGRPPENVDVLFA